MPTIQLETRVCAPAELVFDLSRDLDLHQESAAATKEVAIAGRTTGLIELGERVTWEANHLGVRQRMTVEITEFDRPRHFRDSMIKGAFARYDHDHIFEEIGGGITLMRDVFDYTSPLGLLGKLADLLFLEQYMRRFLLVRNEFIREVAERRHQNPDGAPN